MNLHAMARGIIPTVNPDIKVTVRASNGYTTATDGTQQPTYNEVTNVICQMQPLSSGEIKHLDGLNIQGDIRGFWFNGTIRGINRPLKKGGDLIILADGSKWLVVHVFEDWSPTAGWSHVGAQRQM